MKNFALAAVVALAMTASPAFGEAPVRIFDARRSIDPREPTAKTRARFEQLILGDASWRPRSCGHKSFEFVDVAKGAFTRPGAKQQAVLYRVCWVTRLSHEQGIAVIEAGRVVAHVSYVGRDFAIRALPDIDGNGLSEILVYESDDGQGTSYSGVYLFELPSKGVRWLGRFSVAHDNCGAVDNGTETAAVLYASRGPTLSFFKEEFVRRCESTRAWRRSKARVPVTPASGKRESYLRLR